MKKEQKLPAGKLPAVVLGRLLEECVWTDDSVVIGPAVGIDAAVIDTSVRLLALTSDPITFTAGHLGPWSLKINANDIAVMGAVPRWFLVTLLLPEGDATVPMAEEIFFELGQSCRNMGVSLCGGHTEITDAVKRPVLCGHMVGEVGPSGVVSSAGAKPGDVLILTKGIAIEGTGVLAREARSRLEHLGTEFCDQAASFIQNPGISIVEEAVTAAESGKVHAMHDPTEGGLATALHEVASASGIGIELNADRVNIYPETRIICRELGLDPMGLLASGALLLVTDAEDASPVRESVRRLGIDVEIIGRCTENTGNLFVLQGDTRIPLKWFERDEIIRALSP